MEIKYTKSGKKVAVLGKLNKESWIVQELFVANGHEYPAGENFIETTLLDKPAETWHAREEKRLELRKAELEKEVKKLRSQTKILYRKSSAAKLINEAIAKYEKVDVAQLETFLNFISGNITHIVIEKYGDYEIVSLLDAVEATDSYIGENSLDGLKLVSLFGCSKDGTRDENDRAFRLDWRINDYRDGSGSYKHIYPCKSHREAVSLVDSLITNLEATESLIKLKEKYALTNPLEEKIAVFIQRQIESKKKQIETQRETLSKFEDELKNMVRP